MYQNVFDSICAHANVVNDAQRIQLLQSLKPHMQVLYNGFRQGHVRVDYSAPPIQQAYLMRYFGHYSQMVPELIKEKVVPHFKLCDSNNNVKITLVGGGPCSEIYGLCGLIRNVHPQCSVTAKIYDINSSGWSYARSITKSLIDADFPTLNCLIESQGADYTTENFIEKIQADAASSDVIVFQNCLNEFDFNIRKQVLKNVTSVLGCLKMGGIMVIVDRATNWPDVKQLIADIENAAPKSSYSVLDSVNDYHHLRRDYAIPSIIAENLFTGESGLIPTKNVPYEGFVLRRI